MKKKYLIPIVSFLSICATGCNSDNYIKLGFEGGGISPPRILTGLKAKDVQQKNYHFEFYIGVFSDVEKWWYDEFIPNFPNYKPIISFKVFESITSEVIFKKYYEADNFPNLDMYKAETLTREGWVDYFEIKYKNHIDIDLLDSEVNLSKYNRGYIEIFFTIFNTITNKDLSEQDIYTLLNPEFPLFTSPRILNFETLNDDKIKFSINYN